MKKPTSQFIATFFASCFYAGYFPVAPGTVGSLLAVVIYWIVPGSSWINITLLSAVLFFFGVWCSTIAEKEWGHDNGKIIIDEFMGMFVSIIAIPKLTFLVIIAFLLFRVFDIVKPFPIQQSQNLNAGWGIMVDDLLAGIFTNILLRIVVWIFI